MDMDMDMGGSTCHKEAARGGYLTAWVGAGAP